MAKEKGDILNYNVNGMDTLGEYAGVVAANVKELEAKKAQLQELKKMQQLTNLIEHPVMETEAMMTARVIHDMSANFHKEYDGMGLCEFLEDHLWKFQREWWIRDNIDTKSSRNLLNTYSQNPYRELLNMHRSSNPYINDLLFNTKYDNIYNKKIIIEKGMYMNEFK